MKLFKLLADTEFEAEDLDDAFDKLSAHFRKMRDGEDSSLLIGGEIKMYGVVSSVHES